MFRLRAKVYLSRVGMIVQICGFMIGLGFPLHAQANEKVQEHLEFLGYQVEKMEQGVTVTHTTKLGFLIVDLQDGFLFQAAFAGNADPKNASDNIKERYGPVNVLNKNSAVARFFWADSGELVMRAWFPGPYERTRFVLFMGPWEKDTLLLKNHYEELKTFLK